MNDALSMPKDMNAEERSADTRSVFGFWVYLMTDCVLFASLFAVFAVLRGNTFGGPDTSDLFSLPFVLVETILLLVSSFTCGFALLAAQTGKTKHVLGWLGATSLLGALFLALELSEFVQLVQEGNGWDRSGFLSSYFTLVGTHGVHVAVGLLWMIVLGIRISQRGLTRFNLRKMLLLSLFWHFLDIIWIFIFTMVYLLGVV